MRIHFYLFLSLFISQSLYAEENPDLTNALSVLNKQVSKLKGPDSIKNKFHFKKSTKGVDKCVFPDSPDYIAPQWICHEPVAGYPVSAVGSAIESVNADNVKELSDARGTYINKIDTRTKAFVDALMLINKNIETHVETTNKKYKGENIKKKSEDITKQITTFTSSSGRMKINDMVKHIREYDKDNKIINKTVFRISELVFSSESCELLIRQYVEFKNSKIVENNESTVSRGLCGFYQLVDEMKSSGYELLKMLKSPKDKYYALVGIPSFELKKLAKEKIKESMKSDINLWKKFKAGGKQK